MQREYVTARQVLKLANTIIRNRNIHLKELDLTAEQADSLQFFLSKENSTATDLKKHLNVTHQTSRGIVERLKQKKLVVLQKSEEDARCHVVIPTAAGREMGERLKNNGTHTGEKLLYGMNEDEKEQFINMLKRALDNINE